MYLTKIRVNNLGPIERAYIDPQFSANGLPKPILLVGANGGGKTVLLSTLAESLIEAAALKFEKVTPVEANGRNWYKISGGTSIRAGKTGALSLIELTTSGGQQLNFIDKSGVVDSRLVGELIPASLRESIPSDGRPHKAFYDKDSKAVEEFKNGVYCFFTADRTDKPSWLNPKLFFSPKKDEQALRQTNDIPNAIIVERMIGSLQQWIPTVLIEARADVIERTDQTGKAFLSLNHGGDLSLTSRSLKLWTYLNKIFQLIIGDDQAKLGWLGRHAQQPVGYIAPSLGTGAVTLDCLSKGQSSLLGIFLTLLMQADAIRKAEDINSLTGVCLIDEADAHLHSNLQANALPKLMALFPGIQFVISSHSPILPIGMERAYGKNGLQLVTMPSGTNTSLEDYEEQRDLFEIITATEAFIAKASAYKSDTTFVLTEGKTDAAYLRAAIKTLGRESDFKKIFIEEVGYQSPQVTNCGKDGLNNFYKVMSAKPNWTAARFILLYDADCNKPSVEGFVNVISVPVSPEGTICNGIENLIPPSVFSDQELIELLPSKPAGPGSITLKQNDPKSAICEYMCSKHETSLRCFEPLLTTILEIVSKSQHGGIPGK